MKKILFLTMMLLTGSFMASCSSDDDDYLNELPTPVERSFSQKYPDTKGVRWQSEQGRFKTKFRDRHGMETEVWFMPDGTWVRTETEVRPAALPQAVKDFVTAVYPGYYVDEADYIETPVTAYFHLELECKGRPDVEVNVYADGTPAEGIFTDGDITADQVPAVVAAALADLYPYAVVKEWEIEGGYFKAEFRLSDGTEAEAYFDVDGYWIRTKMDYHGALPASITDFIALNYAGYKVDDVEYVQTPVGDYYEVELERKGRPDVTLLIGADGTPWT